MMARQTLITACWIVIWSMAVGVSLASAMNGAGIRIPPKRWAESSSLLRSDFVHPAPKVALSNPATQRTTTLRNPRLAATIPAQANALIPLCGGDPSKTPIPTWKPVINSKGNLSSLPEVNDGQILWIDLSLPIGERKKCDNQEIDWLGAPNDQENALMGGTEVGMNGNAHRQGATCHLSGFYMNYRVFGMHQGWTSVLFDAIDEKKLGAANRYCRSQAPLKTNKTTDTFKAPTVMPPVTNAIPVCTQHDLRTAVPVWSSHNEEEESYKKMSPSHLKTEKIFYIQLYSDMDNRTYCNNKEFDAFKPFKKRLLLVQLRGNNQYANGACYFSGFYRIDAVEQKRGETTVRFEPIEKKTMALSNRYCLSP